MMPLWPMPESFWWESVRDRRGGNRITYTSGPIEDFHINEMAIDILEDTRPVFDNRRTKYWAG